MTCSLALLNLCRKKNTSLSYSKYTLWYDTYCIKDLKERIYLESMIKKLLCRRLLMRLTFQRFISKYSNFLKLKGEIARSAEMRLNWLFKRRSMCMSFMSSRIRRFKSIFSISKLLIIRWLSSYMMRKHINWCPAWRKTLCAAKSLCLACLIYLRNYWMSLYIMIQTLISNKFSIVNCKHNKKLI